MALGLLIYGMTTKLSTKKSVSIGSVTLPLPMDCRLAQVEATDERILLRLEGPAERGCQKVLVYSAVDGSKEGEFVAEIDKM